MGSSASGTKKYDEAPPTTAKVRADILLFSQGLASSRQQARALIEQGYVSLQNGSILTKPGQNLAPDTPLCLSQEKSYVSRGAYKLLTALEHFSINPTGLICMDAGASTGGFTHCLLDHGARHVYAVDVGHGQLHPMLQNHPQVTSYEGINLRHAAPTLLPEKIDMAVFDVSFISLTLVLPACLQYLRPGGQVIALIKPQFELGPKACPKGVVRDETLRKQAVNKVLYFSCTLGLFLKGTVPSAILGPEGNQEYLAWWLWPASGTKMETV